MRARVPRLQLTRLRKPQCPDEFVVGYGLDYAGRYRELPYVGIMRPDCI